VSVVVPTCNRAARLGRLLEALRRQTLDRERFEVIVVDDASDDETSAVLARASGDSALRLKAMRNEDRRGPAATREIGWRAASAPLIAFTDDDCEPEAGWLEAGVRASQSPRRFVQGRTLPQPSELASARGFFRTIEVSALDPNFHTCNIFYPRSLLERIEGFDTVAFDHGGEDSDLGWRAIEAGAEPLFAADALAYHAVNQLGPLGKLRVAARWTKAMRVYVAHPELRRRTFFLRIFWKREHLWLLLAAVALLLPRRRLLRWLLVIPCARVAYGRAMTEAGTALAAPYFVLYDFVEVVTVARAAVRYRFPML
jgi:glycosyltransferase involved in cell wall biosynthesis